MYNLMGLGAVTLTVTTGLSRLAHPAGGEHPNALRGRLELHRLRR